MKKIICLLVMCILIVYTQAQDSITVSSGGTTIVSGIDVTGTKTICTGSSLSLTVAYSGFIDHIAWVANPGGTGAFTPNNTNLTVTVTPSGTTDYFVYVYDAPAHYVGYVRVTVFLASLPATQTITVDGAPVLNGSYCQGELGNVAGLQTSQVGYIYELQESLAPNTVRASVTGTGTAISFPAQLAGSYRVVATSPVGCQIIF